jgi:hypothetical protein
MTPVSFDRSTRARAAASTSTSSLPDVVLIGPLNQLLETIGRERLAGVHGHVEVRHDGSYGEDVGRQSLIGARCGGRPARARALSVWPAAARAIAAHSSVASFVLRHFVRRTDMKISFAGCAAQKLERARSLDDSRG